MGRKPFFAHDSNCTEIKHKRDCNIQTGPSQFMVFKEIITKKMMIYFQVQEKSADIAECYQCVNTVFRMFFNLKIIITLLWQFLFHLLLS